MEGLGRLETEHISAAGLLGLDEEQDDVKEQAVAVLQPPTRRQKQKLSHKDFFDDERGLKKVLKTFPSIKFQGKGREFDDLKMLISRYERWFKELSPATDHIEDAAMRARIVLQEKERLEDGRDSDPHEKLHLLRFRYKSDPLLTAAAPTQKTALSDEAARRIEENKRRALELREAKRAKAAAEQGGGGAPMEADMEEAERRARELELQRQRAAAALDEDEEDVFGFGHGGGGGLDDEEDVFGFGGDIGGGAPAPKAAPVAAAAPAPAEVDAEAARRIAENRARALALKQQKQQQKQQTSAPAPASAPAQQEPTAAGEEGAFDAPPDEEEDVFGFGGGFDEM